tara:strand:+ start:145 stop:1215 length:1071 start_codon:yes stop_codon:yes gene_type:complete
MLAIVCATKDRSEFVSRLLYYYAKVNCPYTIYLADSSEGEHLEEVLSVIDKLNSQIKVVHRAYPGKSGPVAFKEMLGIVQEKYATCLGDDDFLVPNSIEKCIAFLEDNQEYATAHGKAVLYTLDRVGAYGRIESFGGYNLGENEYKTPNQRLVYFLSNYWVIGFSVHRTKEFNQAYEQCDVLQDDRFTEVLNGCISIIHGKSKLIDCLYLFRQVHNQRDKTRKSTLDWITNRNWQPSFQIFHDRVVEALKQYEGITRETASDIVKQAYWKHFAGGVCAEIQAQKVFRKGTIAFQSKVKRIPGLGYLYRNIKSRIPGPQNAFCLENMLKRSSSYHKDFMPVYNVITSSEVKITSEIF